MAVCAHESVLGAVEAVQKPLVERHSGTQYCREDELLVALLAYALAQRCLYFGVAVTQVLGYFVCHGMADAPQVLAETQRVFLYADLTELEHVAAHEARGVGKVDYFHNVHNLSTYKNSKKYGDALYPPEKTPSRQPHLGSPWAAKPANCHSEKPPTATTRFIFPLVIN